MNGGTVKGGAYGFKFDYLTKLRDTKSSDNKTNLCHFLVLSIEEDNTELKGFIESVPQLTLAAKGKNLILLKFIVNSLKLICLVSMDLINPRMTLLRQGVRTIEKLLRHYQKINEEDRYEIVMSKFIIEAEEKVRLVEKDLERMNKEYHKFLDSWQETEKNVPLHHVFSTIQIFFNDYRV
jgi:diaphanous 1